MSDVFPVPIAQSQLNQFKKQANILGEEIHAIVGGKVLRGNRTLNLYAIACGYDSYNALLNSSKGICLASDEREVLWILLNSMLPIMADNIANYSSTISRIQAQEALINLRKRNTIAYQTSGMRTTLMPEHFNSTMTDDDLSEIRKSTKADVNKTNTLPTLTIDSSQAPAYVSQLFNEHKEVIAFDKIRSDLHFSNIHHKGHVEQGCKDWQIKVSFDTLGCKSVPADVLEKWLSFKGWLSRLLSTERILLTERKKDHRFLTSVVQVHPTKTNQDILNGLATFEDQDLYKALIKGNDNRSQGVWSEQLIKEHELTVGMDTFTNKPRTGLSVNNSVVQLNFLSTGSAGEQFAGRLRGEEFNNILVPVMNILEDNLHEIKPVFGQTYQLSELANFLYFKLKNTNVFSSLDLAGWLMDNNRKIGISTIHNFQDGPDNELKILDKERGLLTRKDDKGFNRVLSIPLGGGKSYFTVSGSDNTRNPIQGLSASQILGLFELGTNIKLSSSIRDDAQLILNVHLCKNESPTVLSCLENLYGKKGLEEFILLTKKAFLS